MAYRTQKTQTKDIETKKKHADYETGTPVVTVDYEYYARYLCDYDISDEQKRELIGVLANIMMAFVDLGFGIAPGQVDAEKSDKNTPCEQAGVFADFLRENSENLLDCEDLSKTFNDEDARLLCAAEEDAI